MITNVTKALTLAFFPDVALVEEVSASGLIGS